MRKNYLSKQLKHLLAILVVSAILFSCQEDDSVLNISFQTNENIISEEFAYEIAENLVSQSSNCYFEASTVKSGKHAKKVKSIKNIKTKKLKNAIYIVNYEPNGFVLISADKRMDPILAFSEDNSFQTDTEYPDNLKYWLESTVTQIEYVIENNLSQTEEIDLLWEKLVIYPGDGDDEGDDSGDDGGGGSGSDGCTPSTSIKVYGPYMVTAWDQIHCYNNYCPTMSELGCQYGGSLGRALTGCIATAMAQVMRYHEYPDNYNWGIMPNNTIFIPPYDTPSYNEISQLMWDAGLAVGMHYECNGSWAFNKHVSRALNNTFGYANAKLADFSGYIAFRDIKKKRPFIFHGGDHAWVCHGMRVLNYKLESCYELTYYQYYMNWGASGDFDGYYIKGRFNPAGNDFNGHLEMTYNIYK
ncbi:C10 family peptidase [Bacteroidota bacterium]